MFPILFIAFAMYSIGVRGHRLVQSFSCFSGISRSLCSGKKNCGYGGGDDGFMSIEGLLNEAWMSSDKDFANTKPK